MTYRLLSYSCALLLAISACGPGGDGDDGGEQLPDLDGDFISDVDEGCAEGRDSDADGIPDCEDADSDNDGIPDAVEAGDQDTNTAPPDSDSDGMPDYVDTDSDNNGWLDVDEGAGDVDGDGIIDLADLDNDDDLMPDTQEIGPNPSAPVDFDGDGSPDLSDIDSDDDTIMDLHEGTADADQDMMPAYLDMDSDDDCRPDAVEAGDNILETAPLDSDGDGRGDFLDIDSDDDGLLDSAEDANCNGVLDNGETDPTLLDTDGDGTDDLVEGVAGTNPTDPNDNPQNNGDFVFVVPYEGDPDPVEDNLDFSTTIQILDVYTLVDRSGSMTAELTSIRDNIQTVASNLTCPPLGNGDPNDCISDVFWGVGTVGYRGSGGQPYTNHLDMQPNPALVASNIDVSEPSSGCCDEPLHLGTYSAFEGAGSGGDGSCSTTNAYPARASCAGSAADQAGQTGLGYPCFRDNSLPVVLLVTDEPPQNTYNCPNVNAVTAAANNIGGKIIGIMGSTTNTSVRPQLEQLAVGTGAVDALNGNAPLVVQGDNASAAAAIETAIRLMANGVPLDISADPRDDPGDSVDAVAEFVERLETLQLGTPECASGLAESDSNNDGFADLYDDVLPGTPVCWKLIPKQNRTVEPLETPQLFTATIYVEGDGATLLDTRQVFFVVPPQLGGGID